MEREASWIALIMIQSLISWKVEEVMRSNTMKPEKWIQMETKNNDAKRWIEMKG